MKVPRGLLGAKQNQKSTTRPCASAEWRARRVEERSAPAAAPRAFRAPGLYCSLIAGAAGANSAPHA